MADNRISIIAELNIDASANAINSQLPSLEGKINRVKIGCEIGQIDTTALQNQLNQLSNNLRININNVNVGNITTQMQGISQGATTAARDVEKLNQSLHNLSANQLTGTLDNGSSALAHNGNNLNSINVAQTIRNLESLYSNFKSVTTSATYCGEAIEGFSVRITDANDAVKQLNFRINEDRSGLELFSQTYNNIGTQRLFEKTLKADEAQMQKNIKAADDYTLKLSALKRDADAFGESLKTWYKQPSTGIQLSTSLAGLAESINQLRSGNTTIENVRAQYNALKVVINEMSAQATETFSSSLKPLPNIISKVEKLKQVMDDLNNSYYTLNNMNKENLKQFQFNAQNLLSVLGAKTPDSGNFYIAAYGEAKKAVDEYANALKRAKQEEAKDNSSVAKQQASAISELKKEYNELAQNWKKITSGNATEKEIELLNQRNSILTNSIEITKKELENKELVTSEIKKQIEALEQEYSQELKLINTSGNFEKAQQKIYSTITSRVNSLGSLSSNATFVSNAGNQNVLEQQRQIAILKTEYETLLKDLSSTKDFSGLAKIVQRLGELNQRFIQADSSSKQLQSTLKAQSAATTFANNIKKATANLEAWANANKKAVTSQKMMSSGKTYAQAWKELVASFNSGNINPDQFKHLNEQLRIFQTEARAAKLTSSSLFTSMGNQLKSIIARYTSFYMIIGKIKEMMTTVSNLDTAMINLRRVTDESDETYVKFFENAHLKARELHSDLVDIVDQTTAWVKLGYDLQEATDLTKVSGEYIKLSGVDQETGVKNIITAMKAYNIEAADATRITDEFYEVGNKFALSSADIGAGLTVSASALANTGNSLEESIALLAGGGEITQDLNSMGAAARTVAMRLQGMKGELEELGEDSEGIESISKVQTQILNLTKGRVNIFEDNGNFKSTYQILKEISEVYYDLSDPDRANLTEILFGKMRANQGIAILQAFNSGQIERIYETATNASGAIAKGFEEQSESVAYHLADFKEEWQKVSSELISSDGLKFLIDSGTTILGGLESITKLLGNLPTLIIAIGSAVASIKGNNIIGLGANSGGLFNLGKSRLAATNSGVTIGNLFNPASGGKGISDYVDQFNNLQTNINATQKEYAEFYKTLETQRVPSQTIAAFQQLGSSAEKTKATVDGMSQTLLANSRGYQGVTTAISAYNQAAIHGAQAQQGVVTAVGASNTQLQAYLTSLNGAEASMGSYVAYLAAAKVKAIALQAAQMALNMVIASAVSIIVSKLIGAIKEWAEAEEEARRKRLESAEEVSNAYKEEITYSENLKEKYADLLTSTTDVAEQRRQLIDIQNELNEKYDEEADKVDVLNSKYTELIANAREKQRAEAEEYLRDNQVAIEEAERILETTFGTSSIAEATFRETSMARKAIEVEEVEDLLKAIEKNRTVFLVPKGFGMWEKEIAEVWKDIEGVNVVFDEESLAVDDYDVSLRGTIYEQRDALKAMRDAYGEWEGHDSGRLQQLTDLINIYEEVISKEEEYVNSAESAYKIIADSDSAKKIEEQYDGLIEKSVEAIQSFNELKNSNASNVALANAQNEIVGLHDELIELTNGNATLRSEVNNLFEDYLPALDETKANLVDITDIQADWNDIVDGSFKTTLDDVEKYKSAMQSLANGDLLEWKDVQPLLWDLDTEHSINDIQMVNDKYKLSIEEITKAKDNEIHKEIDRINTEIELQIKARDAAIATAQATIDATSLATRHSRNPVYVEAVNQLKKMRDGTDEYTELINKATSAVTALKNQLGDTVDKTEALKAKQSKLNDEISNLKTAADNYAQAMTTSIDNVVDKLNSEKDTLNDQLEVLNDQLDTLEAQKEELEGIIDDYSKIPDTVGKIVDSEIELLEEQKKAQEEAYNERIEMLKEQHEQQEEENELAEKQIALQEKLRDLDKARQTKVRVYSSERGWHYDVDKEAVAKAEADVADAQKNYNDAVSKQAYEAEIKNLESERDTVLNNYDVQIEAYQDYVELWKDVLSEEEEAENERLAAETLGSDYREKIKNKDTIILNRYASNFRSYNSQLQNLTNNEIATLKRSIEAKEAEIAEKDKQIKAWQDYKSEVEKAIKDLENVNAEYNQYMKDIALNERSTLYDREVALRDFTTTYAGYLEEIADKQREVNALSLEMNATLGQIDLGDFMNRINEMTSSIHSTVDEMRLRLYALRSVGSFAEGGVNDRTGVAMLHGTKQRSEVTFNSAQGKSLYDMVKTGNFSNLVADKAIQGIGSILKSGNFNTTNGGNLTISVGQIVTDNPANFMKQLNGYMDGYMRSYWRTKLTESYVRNK